MECAAAVDVQWAVFLVRIYIWCTETQEGPEEHEYGFPADDVPQSEERDELKRRHAAKREGERGNSKEEWEERLVRACMV